MPRFLKPGVRGMGRAAMTAARSASALALAAALALAWAKGLPNLLNTGGGFVTCA